jgi:hypothetical protein
MSLQEQHAKKTGGWIVIAGNVVLWLVWIILALIFILNIQIYPLAKWLEWVE